MYLKCTSDPQAQQMGDHFRPVLLQRGFALASQPTQQLVWYHSYYVPITAEHVQGQQQAQLPDALGFSDCPMSWGELKSMLEDKEREHNCAPTDLESVCMCIASSAVYHMHACC